jgi:hypothetical protein
MADTYVCRNSALHHSNFAGHLIVSSTIKIKKVNFKLHGHKCWISFHSIIDGIRVGRRFKYHAGVLGSMYSTKRPGANPTTFEFTTTTSAL